MGSIIGGVYASGMPIDEIERSAQEIDWALAFQERPDRSAMRARRKRDENGHFARPEFGFRDGNIISPAGVIYGQRLSDILSRLGQRAIGSSDFSQLPIPFSAVATDIATGKPVVLDHGSLPLAMRASMSVPAVMAPVALDGKMLIDGGLVDNLPSSTARKMCGEVLIAVNLGTPLLDRKDIGSAVSVGLQMVNILTEQNVQSALATLTPRDILITPNLEALNASDFDRVEDFIKAGEAAALVAATKLAELAVSPEQFFDWKAGRDRPAIEDFHVDEIKISPLKSVNPEILRADLLGMKNQHTGKSLLDEANRIFERGDFERVQVSIANIDGRRVATIEPTEKSWGPDYLRFGLSMTAQTGESTAFNAVLAYTQTWVNSFGARWQTALQIGERSALHSELMQPFTPGSSLFVAPRLLLTNEISPVYSGPNQLARVTRAQNLAAIEVGAEIGRSGEARLGFLSGREFYEGEVGPIIGSSDWQSIRATTARIDVDAFDKAHFPTQGFRLLVDIFGAKKNLGNDGKYTRQVTEISAADTWSKNTFSALMMSGRTDHSAPFFDQIMLGGFQRMSAFPVGRFRASQVEFGRLGYQRNIPPLLGLNLGGIVSQTYFGGTAEIARIRQTVDPATLDGTYHSTSLFIGADTILGPAAFSYGTDFKGHQSFWISIGIPWTVH